MTRHLTLHLLALAALAAFAGCKDDGPRGDVSIEGLEGPVTARFDEVGMLHLECRTDADCVAALGYFHARDRFWQMDVRRRFATGRLSTLAGALVVEIDVANRALFADREGRWAEERLLESIGDETRAWMEAYARGVNAWLDDLEAGRNGAKLPREYSHPLINGEDIPRWTPADSFATVLALVNDLTNDSSTEIALGQVYAQLAGSPEIYEDFYGNRPARLVNVIDDYTCPSTPSPSRRLRRDPRTALTPELAPLLERALGVTSAFDVLRGAPRGADSIGSNNWAVAPDGTAVGHALFSNDPHLGLSQPSVWYMAHLDAKTHGTGTLHVAGHSFAGLPWIIIGQNEHIAWGATTTYFDFTDVYVEQLTPSGDGVIFNGEEVPFVEREFTLELAGGGTRTETLRWVPHHGPLLAIDEEAGTALSLRWTAQELSTDGEVLTHLSRATSVEEAREALTGFTTIGQNWVVVDVEGTIGWFPYNRLPYRPFADMGEYAPFRPLPGDGSAEWVGTIPLEELPQLLSTSGYVATANNDMTGHLDDGDPTNDCPGVVLQSQAAAGYRQERIQSELQTGFGEHTVDTMLALVGDVHSAIGEQLTPALVQAATEGADDLTTGGQAILAALEAWAYTCPTGLDGFRVDSPLASSASELAEARGCAAFHATIDYLRGLLWNDEVEAYGLSRSPNLQLLVFSLAQPDALAAGDIYWDDVRTDATETKAQLVAAAMNAAAARLQTLLGADPAEWVWGRVHTVSPAADLFSMIGVTDYDGPRYANDGGLFTVDVANPRMGGNYDHRAGASTRFVCEAPASGVRCTFQLPGGQVDDRQSPHFADLLERYVVNEPTPIVFDVRAVEAVETLTLR